MFLQVSRPGRSQELELEEDFEEAVGAQTTREVKAEEKRVCSIGEHEVVEIVRKDDVFAYLRCIKCSLEVKITGIGELSSKPCRRVEVVREEIDERIEEAETCKFCGREAIGRYCTGGQSPNRLLLVPICDECLKKHEELYMKIRPTIVYGKKPVREISSNWGRKDRIG